MKTPSYYRIRLYVNEFYLPYDLYSASNIYHPMKYFNKIFDMRFNIAAFLCNHYINCESG